MAESRVTRIVVVLILVLAGLGACELKARDKPARSAPSTSTTVPAPSVDKLLVFVIENHSLAQMRQKMHYTGHLASTYGYATSYFALRHPSLPNYLAIAGGDTFGVQDDAPPRSHEISGPSVFGGAIGAGRTARVYAESMDSKCQRKAEGDYVPRHNPWTYFVDESDECKSHDVFLSRLKGDVKDGRLPAVGMVVPDLCSDAHDCSLAKADAFLEKQVGRILDGPDWRSGHLAVVITADEDDKHHGNRVLTVVVHPSLRHAVVATSLDHYSLSRSLADVAGIPPLGHAAEAVPLLEAFGLAARKP